MAGILSHPLLLRFRRSTVRESESQVRVGIRSIYILPTKFGFILVFLLMAMLVGSINYGSNLGYLITFLLGGIWLSGILHTWRNLLGLRIAPTKTASVFCGQPAEFSLRVENPGRLPRFGISLKAKGGSKAEKDLQKQSSAKLLITQPTKQRGKLQLSSLSIHTRYPLGLFHAWCYVNLDMLCLVYPRPADYGTPPTEPVYGQADSGDRGMGSDDFVGLRSFRHGDSPRHVDWKALARERGLFSKQFGGDRKEEVSLDWELLPELEVETRLSLLTRFVLLAEEQQQTYGLKLPGTSIKADQGERHKHQCLTALALFRQQDDRVTA
jgi:uncharacterized protein (DUF58 family)